MYWLRIDVHAPEELRDAVANVFFEMGSGVEEPASSRLGTAVVRGYFPEPDPPETADKVVDEVRRRVRAIVGPGADPEVSRIRAEDWAVSWRKGLKPRRVGARLVIKPSWESFAPAPSDLVIELDPGPAFGCGTHPTTAMCLRLLERCVKPGMTVIDVGTGSGILAIAAALLGAGPVWAIDEDPVAVRTARENVFRNNLAGRVRVRDGNLLDDLSEPADLVVANILAEVLAGLCPQAANVLEPGGVFILSGILDRREETLRPVLATHGFRVTERLAEGEWVALVAVKT